MADDCPLVVCRSTRAATKRLHEAVAGSRSTEAVPRSVSLKPFHEEVSEMAPEHPSDVFTEGRPIVFRGGTVLPMDGTGVIERGDVLVVGDRIAGVGTNLAAPDGSIEIDASGGIVMPGMVDTHRHMWQTAMRGYGADWTLTQYFVFYYLTWGKIFRPEDIRAGNV